MSLATATHGGDARSRWRILKRHVQAFVRHASARRLGNFLLAEGERLLGREYAASRPYLLKIEPSNICNMRCPYCHDGRSAPGPGQRPYGRMRLEQFSRLLDDVAPWLFKINLYGFGEPFLFPETCAMIRLAADRNIGVAVSSNMQLDDPACPGAGPGSPACGASGGPGRPFCPWTPPRRPNGWPVWPGRPARRS